ncbi:MAG TPA: diacylglycerol kinase family protein [Solirubrobacteraceae bacterium]|jgi:diacylglycerol kinase family enzyme
MSTPTSEATSKASARADRAPEDFELAAQAEKKRMLIIVNPYASTVSDNLRHLVVHALQGRFEVDAVDTEARGHATEICREAAHEGYDVVVAFGGDGTVNEAANGLLGSSTPLCCLPGGSANVFGRMIGIPGELVDATEHLLGLADDWRPRRVDLGVVNGRCFTFASGLGLDASVVARVDSNPHLKARLGPWYFTWVAVGTFLRRYLVRPPRLHTELGDGAAPLTETRAGGRLRGALSRARAKRSGDGLDGVTAIVQNGSPFTYFKDRPIVIAEDAELQSGTLSGCVLHRARPMDMPSIAWRAFSRRARVSRHRQISSFRGATELTVTTADGKPLPLQVDGDYLGEVTEARYSILPQALSVVA